MNKKGSAVIGVLLALTYFSIANAANLISNGGFETGISGWTFPSNIGNAISSIDSGIYNIEGAKLLRCDILNIDSAGEWLTSMKKPLTTSTLPVGKYTLSITLIKLSALAEISGGIALKDAPWTTFFWTGYIDMEKYPIGRPVTFNFEVEIKTAISAQTAMVLNLGGLVQTILIDDIRLEPVADVTPATTTVAGIITTITTTTPPATAATVVINGEGVQYKKTVPLILTGTGTTRTKSFSTTVPSGKTYVIQLQNATGNVFKTFPYIREVTVSGLAVNGINFQQIP